MIKNRIFLDEGAAGAAPAPDSAGGEGENPNTETTQQPETTNEGQQPSNDMVPYSRFKEILDANKALTGERDQFATQLTEITQERDGLKDQLGSREKENIRLRVALEKGLPIELASRLQGEDAEAIGADADNLLGIIAEKSKPKKSSVPPLQSSGEQNKFDISKATPDEIREARKKGKLDVK